MGLTLRRSGRPSEALAAFQRAIDARADHAAALMQQGEVYAELGCADDAADSFALALAFDGSLVEALIGYGKLMRLGGRSRSAVDHLRRAVELAPGSCEAWVELGLAFNQAGRTDEAAAAYEKAIDADSAQAAGYINLGLLHLTQLGDAQRAEILFRRALELEPASVEAAANLGLSLHDQGRSSEALQHYDRVLDLQPEHVEYRWHRASVRLGLGDYERGWEDHEARKQRAGRWRKPLPLPEWDGRALGEKALLIYAEQGLGDEIMFASCVPDVLRVVGKCVIECDLRLAPMFRRSFPQASVHGVDRRKDDLSWLVRYPELAAQCAIGSLPQYFRRSLAAFPVRPSYLVPDPERIQHWRRVVGSGDDALKIGIAWRGGTVETRGRLRSTALADWGPILSSRNARFFALQSGEAAELQDARQRLGAAIEDFGSVSADMDELAALIAALDLVITVQGTIAHVAGATGQHVWVLLSHSAEWRYLRDGNRMPWYRSARLFRQTAPQAWPEVFRDVAQALAGFDARAAQGGASPRADTA